MSHHFTYGQVTSVALFVSSESLLGENNHFMLICPWPYSYSILVQTLCENHENNVMS
jgi:hypothetical protein